LTAQTLAVEGLSYIGVFSIGPAATPWTIFSTARAAILARIAHDQTAAMQDIVRARSDLFQTRIGMPVAAPQTLNVLLTNGSTAVNLNGSVFAANLDGATVCANGLWNETRQTSPNAVVTLLHPFAGTTGTVALTVYGDSLLVDTSKYSRVAGDVCRGDIKLNPLPNRDALKDSLCGWTSDYGGRRCRGQGAMRYPGPPEAYWVESTTGPAGSVLRIRLAPLPEYPCSLDVDLELRAPVITVGNLAATDGSDPGIIFKLPGGLDESILSALFLGRFCKSPWVKDADHRTFLIQDASDAMKKLMAFQKQAESGATMKSRGMGW